MTFDPADGAVNDGGATTYGSTVGHDGPSLRPRRARATVGSRIRTVVVVVLGIAVVAGGVWAATHPQRIVDQVAVWQFSPDATIQSYAQRTTMTDEGRFLFYASHPQVVADSAFQGICSSRQENVGILGCYLPSDRTIFLYDITDARLDGLEDTVAAHEMLHAAWDRMSADERAALAPLLEAEAATRSGDAEFAETLDFYATAEPGERLNELHSIIGTEFTSISPALEAHYALYFTDRPAVAALHEKSIAVFREQTKAIDSLTAQLDALNALITADYASYNAQYDTLEADIADFNARADSGSFGSQAQFTAERNVLLSRQDDLNAFYDSIDARRAQYDDLVSQLTALNAQIDELNKSINIAPRDQSGL